MKIEGFFVINKILYRVLLLPPIGFKICSFTKFCKSLVAIAFKVLVMPLYFVAFIMPSKTAIIRSIHSKNSNSNSLSALIILLRIPPGFLLPIIIHEPIMFSILKEKVVGKPDFAEKMEKSPSDVSKWLSGTHNLIIKTMAKIENTLGEELIQIDKEYKYVKFAEIMEVEAVYAYKEQNTEELLKLQAEAFHNLQVKNL